MNSANAQDGPKLQFSSLTKLPQDSSFHPQSNISTQQSFSENSQAILPEVQKDSSNLNLSINPGHNEVPSSPNNPLLLTNNGTLAREMTENSPTRQINHHKDAKLYYLRKLGFFVFIGISALLIRAYMNGSVTFDALFLASEIYLVYLALESFVRRAYFQTKENKKREDILSFFGALAAFVYVGSVHLKLVNSQISWSILGAVPVIMSPACYLKFSMASEEKKLRKFVICIFFAVQVLLINLKLEGILTTNWKLIFGPLWLFFGGLSLHFVAYGLLFVFSLPVLLKRSDDPNEARDHKLYTFGVFWTTLYYSISVCIFGILFGFVQKWSGKSARRDNGEENILNGSLAGMIISSLLIMITAIGFKYLIEYQQMIGYSQGVVQSAEMLTAFSNKLKTPVIEFKAEKLEAYFMMQSATYFLPYKLNKNEEMLLPINHHHSSIEVKASDSKEDGAQYQEDGIVRKRLISSLNNLDDKEENILIQRKNKNEEDKLCYLCFRDEPNVVLGGCGHGGVCYGCIMTVVQRKNECMQCRAKVKEIYKVMDGSKKSGDIVKAFEMIKVIELE